VLWGPGRPAEDEFALATAGVSPYLAWTFPKKAETYERYLTLEALTSEERDAWKQAFHRFLQAVSFQSCKPLILKSPPHTARIKVLLELYPDARFIHLRRNPFDVFASTVRLVREGTRPLRLQRLNQDDVEAGVLRRHRRMYDSFFDDWPMIVSARKCELRYEDLVARPIQNLQRIYEALDLPSFEHALPAVEQRLSQSPLHAPRTYEPPPAFRVRVAMEQRRCFDEWSYPVDPRALAA
jgi:hypothetical protein